MPIHDLGYRSWDGRRTVRALRLLVVATTGVALVWRGPWLRRMLLFAWVPALPALAGFFFYEQSIFDWRFREFVAAGINDLLGRPDLAFRYLADPGAVRSEVWAAILLAFFRYPQALVMVVLFGLIAPRLISYDLRSRAYLLYFSRPLGPAEYLAGKALVLAFVLASITTLPALIVYGVGVLLSPDAIVAAATWDLPLRVCVATLVLTIPTTAVALCYSSLTKESRFATFAWFATWVIGWVSYGTLTSGELIGGQMRPEAADRSEVIDRWRLLSPYHTLGDLQAAAFGVLEDWNTIQPAVFLASAVTVAAIGVAYYRVAGQLRI